MCNCSAFRTSNAPFQDEAWANIVSCCLILMVELARVLPRRAQTEGGSANYMRHASGQFYGVSAPVARYVARSASVLYKYANE